MAKNTNTTDFVKKYEEQQNNAIAKEAQSFFQKNPGTKKEIATLLGISVRTLDRYISGSNPPDGKYFSALAAAIKITPNTLLGWESSELNLTEAEKEIIERYRKDEKFKKMIDLLNTSH